jgi:hypothetical protein
VNKILKQDLLVNISSLERFTTNRPALLAQGVEAAIATEISERGRDAVRRDKQSVAQAVLWIYRSMAYIARLVELLVGSSHEVAECAKEAYNQVLKPYHGMLIATVVRGVMSMVPSSRAQLYGALKLGGDEQAAQRALKQVHSVMVPVLGQLLALLNRQQVNYTDKVQVMPS